MDEKLINITTEEVAKEVSVEENLTSEVREEEIIYNIGVKENSTLEVKEAEIIYDVGVEENSTPEVQEEEIIYSVGVEVEEPIVIDISESMGWVSGDNRYHNSLLGIDYPNQHPITAISGLREELDQIEALKTVESDKFNIANYYKWKDAAYDTHGYFVSLVPGNSEIQICNGSDIFGVSIDVETAGFVGGQADIPRDNSYGLIATSGIVDVRCELDVRPGDYVVSNAYGYAKKSNSNYGYKVIAQENKGGVEYAVIMLGVQADITNAMGEELDAIEKRVSVNEQNIVSAINVSNQAYNKAESAANSASVSKEAVEEALKDILGFGDTLDEMEKSVASSSIVSAQAKAIAESAVVSAESMRKEAVENSKEALSDTSKLRDEFALMEEGVTEIEDQVSIVTKKVNGRYEIVDTISGITKEETTVYYAKDTEKYHYYDYDIPDWAETTNPREAGLSVAIAGIQVETDENSASINNLVSWQGDAKTSMARIEQKADANGAYIQSTVSNMDRYAVGSHSQAYGFTLSQAISVLEEGMIYVPTELHDEHYEYANKAIEVDSWDQEGKEIGEVYYAKDDKRYYYYFEEDWTWEPNLDELPIHGRTFIPGYLYRWSKWTDSPYAWITVDKNYNPLEELNDSTKAVYFTPDEPVISGSFGYWYTDGDDVRMPYEPYTLYWWTYYANEHGSIEYHWVPVATLAGNSQSRAVSQIRQDANSIEMSVTTLDGKYAGTKAWVDENESAIQDTVTWANQNATIKAEANDNGSSVTIAAYSKNESTGEITEKASLVLSSSKDDSTSLVIDADHINFESGNFTVNARNIDFTGDDFSIDANHINFEADNFTINASKVDFTGDDFTIGADRINFTGSEFDVSIGELVDEAVDNINIGGTNLLSKSEMGEQLKTILANSKSGFGYICPKGTAKGNLFGLTSDLDLKPDTEYTISFVAWIDTTDTNATQNFAWDLWPDELPQEFLNATPIPTKYSWTISSPHTTMTDARFRCLTDTNDGTDAGKYEIYVTDIKIEEGNKATAWSPASEDIVKTDKIITCINASKEGVTIQGDKVDIIGNATFKSLTGTENGITVIDGGKIKTGSIDAKSIKSDFVSALNLEVGSNVKMGENATISWNNVTDNDGVATTSYIDDKGYQTASQVTQISKNAISTATINADQIKVTDLNAFNATIGGWGIGDGAIYAENGTQSFELCSPKHLSEGGSQYWINVYDHDNADSYFRVTRQCALEANGVNITGIINATEGYIGGWNIDGTSISAIVGDSIFALYSPEEDFGENTTYWIFALDETTDRHFGITRECVLEANAVKIDGGEIAGFTISGNSLICNSEYGGYNQTMTLKTRGTNTELQLKQESVNETYETLVQSGGLIITHQGDFSGEDINWLGLISKDKNKTYHLYLDHSTKTVKFK